MDKTMNNKLLYIPIDAKQNNPSWTQLTNKN